MPGAHVRIVVLRKWFPPNDQLAAKIAKLCILREDLLIEMHGVYAEDIKDVDGLSAHYRRMYFLRNLMRSQMELSGAIRVLLHSPEFGLLIDKQSDKVKEKFTKVISVLDKVHPLLKDVRNDIGGHVLESAVQAALERMSWDSFDLLDIGPTGDLTHYKFAAELVAEMLLKDVSTEERRTITSSKFADIAELIPTFALIEYCFALYAKDRGLLPLHSIE